MSKRFKEIWANLDASSPKELVVKKLDCLAAEIDYLEGVIEIIGGYAILEKHKKANEKSSEEIRV